MNDYYFVHILSNTYILAFYFFLANIDDIEADGWVISSESCGFLSIGARYVREVEPGEIVELSRHGIRQIDIVERPENKKQAFCIFEYVYFARSDSFFEGQMVYSVRLQCGRQLAREAPVEADIVSSVPESGTAAAHGYAREVINIFYYLNYVNNSSQFLIFFMLYSLDCIFLRFYVRTDM